MHLFDQRILGFIILSLLVILVIVKQTATGSILDKPEGKLLVRAVNICNLFFLLVANPLAALLLITRSFEALDPTRIKIGAAPTLIVLEILGLVFYVSGFFLMSWALASLGRNYQLGGIPPRKVDQMIISGPYRLVRNPMYTAALCISLGLACLTQSLACFVVFGAYLVLLLFLIPVEEEGLRQVYGEQYLNYQRRVARIVPFLY
jgi:protein-S-isoprenylcysteine O-methyltransferase Ste14